VGGSSESSLSCGEGEVRKGSIFMRDLRVNNIVSEEGFERRWNLASLNVLKCCKNLSRCFWMTDA